MPSLKGRDFLSLADFTSDEISMVLRKSQALSRLKPSPQLLRGKNIALLFQKPSTRTRVSFETAVADLGGHPVTLSWNEMQLGRGETIEDTAKVMERYVDGIMARVFSHNDLVQLAKAAKIPVINGLSDKEHPIQILADLLTLVQYKKRLKGLKLAYVGDGNNVCNALLIGCSKTGVNISVARPEGYGPDADAVTIARQAAEESGSEVVVSENPEEAVKDADVVYTDTFVSMGMEKEKEVREKTFLPTYQVNEALFSFAKPDAIFMHCLPAHRGEEVTPKIIDGPNSVVWQEAENRQHTSKGLLSALL